MGNETQYFLWLGKKRWLGVETIKYTMRQKVGWSLGDNQTRYFLNCNGKWQGCIDKWQLANLWKGVCGVLEVCPIKNCFVRKVGFMNSPTKGDKVFHEVKKLVPLSTMTYASLHVEKRNRKFIQSKIYVTSPLYYLV
jgi:hypothetical protein